MEIAARKDAAASAGKTISALYDAHAKMVLGVCRALLRNPDDAEDAAQQAFLSAYRALLGGTAPIDAAAWLATIARNECRQRISRRLAVPATAPLLDEVVAPASGDPAEQARQHAEIELLAAVVAELPERQRQAIVLRDFYGLSYEEVASAMSASEPAVESLLSRARRRVEERVGTVHGVAGVLVVPTSLQDQLAELIPDFAPAAAPVAAGGGAVALFAKVASTPVLTKAAAAAAIATLAVGAEVAVQRGDGGGTPRADRNPPAPATLGRAPAASPVRAATRRTLTHRRSPTRAAVSEVVAPATTTHRVENAAPAPEEPVAAPAAVTHEADDHGGTQGPSPSSGPSAPETSGPSDSSGPGSSDNSGPSDSTDSSGSPDSSGPGSGSSSSSGSGGSSDD